MNRIWLPAKRGFDVVAAALGLMILFPVFLAVAAAVRLSSPGPVLYCQPRVGRHGRLFPCRKFRSMRRDGPPLGTITADGDPRITRVGRLLRRWKLDELPQLWNVLAGDMSLVGPRPDVPGYADRLQGADRCILELRPGITGPASLLFRDEECLLALARDPQAFNDAVVYPEKVRINRKYYEKGSFGRDLGYLAATVWPALTKRMGWDIRLGLDAAGFSARMKTLAENFQADPKCSARQPGPILTGKAAD